MDLPLLACMYIWRAVPSWRTVARHLVVLAARRALPRTGSRIEISRAMMPMTTRSSTRVKARLVLAGMAILVTSGGDVVKRFLGDCKGNFWLWHRCLPAAAGKEGRAKDNTCGRASLWHMWK